MLVLVSMGGIASRLPIERWPRIDGVRWLVQRSWHAEHLDAIVLESLPLSSATCLPAAMRCCASPVTAASSRRYAAAFRCCMWIVPIGRRAHHCRVVAMITASAGQLTRPALEQGALVADLEDIRNAPPLERLIPTGAAQVADWLAGRINP